jgi:type II secretory pathway component PulF
MSEDARQLTEQLAILIQSGLPLAPALRATAEELPQHRLAAGMIRLADQLEAGQTLEAALAADSSLLPEHLRRLIASGAQSGKLADILVRYVDIDRASVDLGRSIRLALAYPIVLMSLLLLLAIFIELYIAPNVAKLWFDFQRPLPFPTRLLLSFSGTNFLVIVGTIAGALLLLFALTRLLSPAVRRRWINRIPMVGPVVRYRALCMWTRLMELLLRQGTPLPDALVLAGQGVADANLAVESEQLAKAVSNGRTLADALGKSRQIPASLTPLVQWGEQSGVLADAFRTAGDVCENRAQLGTALLQSSLQPIVFVVVALGVVFLFNALLGPFVALMHLVTGLSK